MIFLLTLLEFFFVKIGFKLFILFLFDHFPFLWCLVNWISSVVIHVFFSVIILIIWLIWFWFETLSFFGFLHILSHIIFRDHGTLAIGFEQNSGMWILLNWRIFIRISIPIAYSWLESIDFQLVKLDLFFKFFDKWNNFGNFFFDCVDHWAESGVFNEISWYNWLNRVRIKIMILNPVLNGRFLITDPILSNNWGTHSMFWNGASILFPKKT